MSSSSRRLAKTGRGARAGEGQGRREGDARPRWRIHREQNFGRGFLLGPAAHARDRAGLEGVPATRPLKLRL